MDRDLALATLERWNVGQPVSEVALFKAAAAVGVDPFDALTEARYYTDLTNYVNRGGGEMSPYEKHVFSGASGYHSDDMQKTASAYMLSQEELILAHLADNKFVPDIEKLAEAMQQAGTDPNAQQGEQVQQDPELEAQMQQMMQQAQMAQQQQIQAGMVKPTPTAPAQIPPSATGNADQLLYNEVHKDELAQQREQQMQQQMMQQTAQQPQQGSKEQIQQAYSTASPEEKIQHAAPQIGPEHLQRYADTLAQVEETAGLKITDPSQVQKVVKGVEKQDKKIIDEAIKQVTDVQDMGGGGQSYGPMPGSGGGAAPGGAPGGQPGGEDPAAAGAEQGGPPPAPKPQGQGPIPGGGQKPPGGGGQPKPQPGLDKMAYLNFLRNRTFEKLAISPELAERASVERSARTFSGSKKLPFDLTKATRSHLKASKHLSPYDAKGEVGPSSPFAQYLTRTRESVSKRVNQLHNGHPGATLKGFLQGKKAKAIMGAIK